MIKNGIGEGITSTDSINEFSNINKMMSRFRVTNSEIENYLHSEAIRLAYGVDIDVQDRPGEDKKGIPKLFGEAYSIKENLDGVMKETAAKKYLSNKAFPAMTAKMIRERDPEGEVEGWFRKIESMIKNEDK